MKKRLLFINIAALVTLCGCGTNEKPSSQVFSIMSFNTKRNPGIKRLNEIVDIVKDNNPDLIGFQEIKSYTEPFLKAKLSDYKTIYNIRGFDNEGIAIYYKKSKFELLESGHKWLTETPDKMSKIKDSNSYRILNYAVLKEKFSQKVFMHVNTHIDINKDVQTKQMVEFAKIVKSLKSYPTLVTGDFNFNPNTSIYSDFINFDYDDLSISDSRGNKRIDYIFSTQNQFLISDFKVIDHHKYSLTASDHFAIYGKIDFNF